MPQRVERGHAGAEERRRLDRILDEVGLSANEAARIRYHNAAELFGEEEPQLAGE